MIDVLCTVRGCRRPLARGGGTWVCAAGHAFDVARPGYTNLLQPQDRRSDRPGDAETALAARVRWLDRGLADPLFDRVERWIAELRPAAGAAMLDVGCGDGRLLARLALRSGLEPCAIDLSVAALRLAARRMPGATCLAVNADRGLPFTDAAFHVVLSIFGRRNAAELARVLHPGGTLIVAVPAADDLLELRAAVQGAGRPVERVERTCAELAPALVLRRRETVRHRTVLDAAAIGDALEMSYRGGRAAARARAATLDTLKVTLAAELLAFGKAPGQTLAHQAPG